MIRIDWPGAPVLVGSTAASQEKPATRVLTAHAAAFALVTLLTRDSTITLDAIQPAKLPATRLNAYLAGRGKTALAQAAVDADAVITFRSFWPEDPLYPHARRSNIRIVEIDAARPLNGALNGIAIAEPSDDSAVYAALDLAPMPATGEGSAPWLAPSSLGRMADVLVADLTRLDPTSAKTIATNLATMKQKLLALKAEADLGIDLLASITAAPNEWTAGRSTKLAEWLKANDVAVVLLDTEPAPELARALEGSTTKVAVLSRVEGESPDVLKTMENNLDRLKAAFRPR
jgi:hypothetical protein